MYKSPSRLPENARTELAALLNRRFADGLDLHSQVKVAHWNVKGLQFAALHPLFEPSPRRWRCTTTRSPSAP